MSVLPPLDLHAHVEPSIGLRDLEALSAVIFAVTRSLDEAELALGRNDRATIWGVGCHPGLATAQNKFRPEWFAELVQRTPFVGEVGLDGKARVPLEKQIATLRAALGVLQASPRIVSLHSYAATEQLLDVLESTPVRGAILHWWLGDTAQTVRAVSLGCYFSVNAASIGKAGLLEAIPLTRLLTETDHPFGDRRGRSPHRPGRVEEVEAAIGRHHDIQGPDVRRRLWKNLADLVRELECYRLLPRTVRSRLVSVLAADP